MLNIPCVILAGGKSSRMGKDKCFLPFENTTLIKYQYDKMSKLFDNVYISSKVNKFDFECDIIYDNFTDTSSPMIALESILSYINSKKVFIISVDTPLISNETIITLIDNSKNHNITIAKDKKNIHNLCGVFSVNLLKNIRTLIKQDIHKINYLIKTNTNYTVIEFEDDEQFLNINTKEQYNIAEPLANSITTNN